MPLIKDSLVYPAIYDADRTLLSLPPIINGAATAVRSAYVVVVKTLWGVLLQQSQMPCLMLKQPACVAMKLHCGGMQSKVKMQHTASFSPLS